MFRQHIEVPKEIVWNMFALNIDTCGRNTLEY